MRLDEALRQLLREFKLPGEAQQIDRIMEKFAEAFCKQNPGMFRAAEDAYRLAFATIMLNTDTHNPLADHMLGFDTFVEMNSDSGEDGEAVPALSREDLRGIFDRIVAKALPLMPIDPHMYAMCRSELRGLSNSCCTYPAPMDMQCCMERSSRGYVPVWRLTCEHL